MFVALVVDGLGGSWASVSVVVGAWGLMGGGAGRAILEDVSHQTSFS